jgi:FkbM family methyltransferase
MGAIKRATDRTVRAAARLTGTRRSHVDALRAAGRSFFERWRSYVDGLRESRRSYGEKRDALDMDHLHVMLGFWLTADSNCIDIGANRGSVLEMFEERAPHGTHHAFEPLPHLASRLCEKFPAVTVHQVALADAPGTADFTVVDLERYDGYSGLTRSLRALPADWPTHATVVDTARLDDLLPRAYVPRFMKIDVEDAELAVLRGAQRILGEHRPILFIEHGVGHQTAEIHALLTGLGYAIYNADGGGPYEDVDAMIAGARGRNGWLWNWVCL